MNRWIKTLLLWLVMAALPVQGFAAAVQLSCSPSHHAAVLQAQQQHTHQHMDAAAGHQHDMQSGHQHDGPAQHDAGAGQHDGKAAHDGNTSCSACAACCMGAALAPQVSLTVPAAPAARAVPVFHPQLLSGYIPPNLERPPKPISA